MKKKQAINSAKQYYEATGEHAFVIHFGDMYDWFSESYFDGGFEGGKVVWGTTWA